MEASTHVSAAGPVNILLVDDQPAKLLVYEEILGGLGETLIKANSAREALDHLLRMEFAVVLIDVQMPELDGFELAALIREHPRFSRIALVFVSAVQISELDQLKGYRSGAVDYVSVPIVPEILRAKVGVFVDLYRKTRELETLNHELESRVEARTLELRAAAAELRVTEERLNLALDSAGAAAWDWDARNDVLDWTPRFRALYGFDTDDSPSLATVLARAHADDRPRLATRIAEMLATPGDDLWVETFRIVHPRSGVREISGLGRALRDEHGQVVRMTGIDLDVSDRIHAERALKEADRRKDDFLATLAHELRNPLAPILNAVELLIDGVAQPQGRDRMLAIIRRQTSHLVRLVDDLLDVSRITSGKIALQREHVSLGTVIARAIETCEPLLEQRRVHVEIWGQPEALVVDGDATRLVQVMSNLLNNAAKFSDLGSSIDIVAQREDESAVVSVIDRGVGMDPASMTRVFELFTQVQVDGHRVGGGLGVGLALARQLLRMHGGSVTARSEGLGRGSEFMIRLPLSEMPESNDAISEPEPHGQSLHILIADDDEDVLEMLSSVLESQGHEVRTARDGLEAVAAAESMRPQVAILDIGMPRLDGYGAARGIRAIPGGAAIKLIAHTGWGQPEDIKRAVEAGFDLHLTKPIDIRRLADALAGLEIR